MSALNDSLTDREVKHEFDLHSPLWETEHMNDDDVQVLRAETARMDRRPVGIAQTRAYHPHSAQARAEQELYDAYMDFDDEEEV